MTPTAGGIGRCNLVMPGRGAMGAKRAARVTPVSWPGLARPSTSLPTSAPPVVDGRAKPGHDTVGTTVLPALYFSANGFNVDGAQARHPHLCFTRHRKTRMAARSPCLALSRVGAMPLRN